MDNPKSDEYVSLNLTFIECIETFIAVYIFGVMRRIADDTNTSGIIQVTRLLGLRLRLR